MSRSPSSVARWTRRTLLVSAGVIGGGLALGVALAPNRLKMGADTAGDGEIFLNTWVKLTPDNRITVLIPHSEMGQGAGTGLAQMLAEEMDADWETVAIQDAPLTDAYVNSDLGRGYLLGDAAAVPDFMFRFIDFSLLQVARELVGQMTGGSTAIRLTGQYGMRRAGAAAREMLLKAAAAEWEVPRAELEASGSVVRHPASGRSATYGSLATRAAAFTPSLTPPLKDPSAFRIVGQSKQRLDLPGKVDGSAKFGIDVVVPGMRYAAVQLPPVLEARAASVDAGGLPVGAQVLNLGDAVAVVADSYWTASRALAALKVEWTGGLADLSSEGQARMMTAALADSEREKVDAEGNVAEADGAVLSAEYAVPYLAHAAMEPLNCTASVRDDACEVWVGHQNVLFARKAVAETLKLPQDRVIIHKMLLGGGFGRRSENDFVTLAVRIAQQAGVPVKTIWSRETDMTNDRYRPAVRSRLEAKLKDGRISALSHVYIDAGVMPDSERAFEFQYDVPNRRVERVFRRSEVSVGAWRSVDFTQMGFFHESFMDELAHAAGADPFAFRLAHTTDPRIRRVLEQLGADANWGAQLGPRRAQGVAMVRSFETIVAQAVDASVSEDGRIRVHNVVSVVDCGVVVNPVAARAQITGSVIFALTAALFGEITIKDGRVLQRNFPNYDMLRLANTPRQSVRFIESREHPGGLGEPGVPPAAPALINAIFAATGQRIRELPIRRSGLQSV
jgi:isoquinoline 1-oxidoreductase subunit beta